MRRGVVSAAVLATVVTPASAALGQGLGLSASRWLTSPHVSDYRLGLPQGSLGPLRIGGYARYVRRTGEAGRDQLYGGGLDLGANLRPDARPYLVGGVSSGVGNPAGPPGLGLWLGYSLGAGFELLRGAGIGLQAEIRYQQISRPSVRGVSLGLRVGTALGRSGQRPAGAATPPGQRPEPEPREPVPAARPLPPAEAPPGTLAVADSLASAPARAAGRRAAEIALEAMGTPYRWGGRREDGFDCSGLIQYAYAQVGVTLPRRSVDQALSGYEVPSDTTQLLPGDILAFSREERGHEVTHVGLYVGDGRFIHSSATGVRVSPLFPEDAEGGWWWRRWIGTRRITVSGKP